MLFIATPVLAEKPSWAGGGKPTAEQKEAHKSLQNVKDKMEDEREDYAGKMKSVEDEHEANKDKMKKAKKSKGDKVKQEVAEKEMAMEKEAKGLEKQTTMKAEQERKELDKGSDAGREARETHSKKWWKFW